MKYFVFLFSFGLSITAFSANTIAEVPFDVLDNLEIIENRTLIYEQKEQNKDKDVIAFKCYYAVEWLYKDSPFVEKLEALA